MPANAGIVSYGVGLLIVVLVIRLWRLMWGVWWMGLKQPISFAICAVIH